MVAVLSKKETQAVSDALCQKEASRAILDALGGSLDEQRRFLSKFGLRLNGKDIESLSKKERIETYREDFGSVSVVTYQEGGYHYFTVQDEEGRDIATGMYQLQQSLALTQARIAVEGYYKEKGERHECFPLIP